MSPPEKPGTMNGEHEAIWTFMLHLDSKIDRLTWILVVGLIGVIAAIVGAGQ